MSDTTIIVLLTAGLIGAIIMIEFQSEKIRKLQQKIRDYEHDISVK